MNYTYLPSTPYSTLPTIIMTTNPSSRKTLNLLRNPRVSLLVHDWVSHRPPTATLPTTTAQHGFSPPSPPSPEDSLPANGASLSRQTSGSAAQQQHRSSLASLLLNLNSSSLSSISATINGTARLVPPGTEQERWFKARHLENHALGEGQEAEEGDGGRGCFIEGEEVRVVVVRIRDGRIADWKGGVKDWVLEGGEEDDGEVGGGSGEEVMVDGV
ncbi:hypothetical protein EV356DRAFT_497447 [Viridothelium virens]|uniref:Uncharacterized protein n=1 Tax=Viridothelium virens TaxID=1048519 RepID=A0A6A6GTH5_VIRVR|nr:hypothetical protein EV356DRAFT_497447 [Viridothelium virens]